MALFTNAIENKLQAQYALGGDLEKQNVICKVFNAFGPGYWYIINQDPEDPDYLWCIASFDQKTWEVGSVLKSELESIKRGRISLIERDRFFKEINAAEAFKKLCNGEHL